MWLLDYRDFSNYRETLLCWLYLPPRNTGPSRLFFHDIWSIPLRLPWCRIVPGRRWIHWWIVFILYGAPNIASITIASLLPLILWIPNLILTRVHCHRHMNIGKNSINLKHLSHTWSQSSSRSTFTELVEPSDEPDSGWSAAVSPASSPLTSKHYDIILATLDHRTKGWNFVGVVSQGFL